jgi:hypothetical protein
MGKFALGAWKIKQGSLAQYERSESGYSLAIQQPWRELR